MVAIMALGLIACVRETFSLFWGIVSLMIYPGPKKILNYFFRKNQTF
jgi:hypothetical protein